MSNRGIIKWQPFSAVIPSNNIIHDILKEKNTITKPILSDDQENEIQAKILNAYYEVETITIIYYKKGKLYKITGKITKIDKIYHKICINNHFFVFFSQIIKVL